eukprot:g3827.t1
MFSTSVFWPRVKGVFAAFADSRGRCDGVACDGVNPSTDILGCEVYSPWINDDPRDAATDEVFPTCASLLRGKGVCAAFVDSRGCCDGVASDGVNPSTDIFGCDVYSPWINDEPRDAATDEVFPTCASLPRGKGLCAAFVDSRGCCDGVACDGVNPSTDIFGCDVYSPWINDDPRDAATDEVFPTCASLLRGKGVCAAFVDSRGCCDGVACDAVNPSTDIFGCDVYSP